jgi:hypothetical protein
MKIRYKVVTAHRRSVSLWPGSKYCLRYKKGQVVEAVPGSFGIMVFTSKHYAQMFKINKSHKILKVQPVGRQKTPKMISPISTLNARELTTIFNRFYYCVKNHKSRITLIGRPYHKKQIPAIEPPPGMECYPKVRVLE